MGDQFFIGDEKTDEEAEVVHFETLHNKFNNKADGAVGELEECAEHGEDGKRDPTCADVMVQPANE